MGQVDERAFVGVHGTKLRRTISSVKRYLGRIGRKLLCEIDSDFALMRDRLVANAPAEIRLMIEIIAPRPCDRQAVFRCKTNGLHVTALPPFTSRRSLVCPFLLRPLYAQRAGDFFSVAQDHIRIGAGCAVPTKPGQSSGFCRTRSR